MSNFQKLLFKFVFLLNSNIIAKSKLIRLEKKLGSISHVNNFLLLECWIRFSQIFLYFHNLISVYRFIRSYKVQLYILCFPLWFNLLCSGINRWILLRTTCAGGQAKKSFFFLDPSCPRFFHRVIYFTSFCVMCAKYYSFLHFTLFSCSGWQSFLLSISTLVNFAVHGRIRRYNHNSNACILLYMDSEIVHASTPYKRTE